MSRYRKIDVRVWGDERFRRLSPSGQMLWFFLLTGPHTTSLPGLSRAGEAALAEELGWTQKAFRDAFAEVSREGMAKADWKARVLWVPNVCKYDKPQAPNVVRSWGVVWDEIPECHLKMEAYQTLKVFAKGIGEGYRKAFEEALPMPSSKALAIPEPEPEPDSFREASSPKASPIDRFPEFWERYPKKAARDEAAKAWRKLDAEEQALAIEKVVLYAKAMAGRTEYVKNAQGWLNGRRWEDDPSTWGRNGSSSPAPAAVHPSLMTEAERAYERERSERLRATGRPAEAAKGAA